jgi:hypothetical protein
MNKDIKIKIKSVENYPRFMEEYANNLAELWIQLLNKFHEMISTVESMMEDCYEKLDCPYGTSKEDMYEYFTDLFKMQEKINIAKKSKDTEKEAEQIFQFIKGGYKA